MAWELRAEVRLTDGEVLTLRQNDAAFEIRIGLYQLMSSGNSTSEQALARTCCATVDRHDVRVLIGGLGLGYTLRAVLDALGPGAQVTVAELIPEVVAWNRQILAPLAGYPLDDPRVCIRTGDVRDVVSDHPNAFDIILMDTDNGPDAVLFDGNSTLYAAAGINLLMSGLAPGGILGIWAATPSLTFESTLSRQDVGYARQTITVQDGLDHTLYLIRQ